MCWTGSRKSQLHGPVLLIAGTVHSEERSQDVPRDRNSTHFKDVVTELRVQMRKF